MANGDGGEDFSDAANSIIDSFSQLQESMQDYADQLSEMHDDAGDTLFDSDFMNSLNESLYILSENSSTHIDKQDALIGSIEDLERKMEELGKKLESAQVGAGGGGGGGASPIDYNRLENSVTEGVSSGLEQSEITVGGGGSIASLTDRLGGWLEVLSGNLSPEGRPGGLTGEDLMELAMEGDPGMGMVRDSMSNLIDALEEEHVPGARAQGGALSQILGAGGGLPQGFPELFENLSPEKIELFSGQIRASVGALEDMGVEIEELTEKGTKFKDQVFISLSDVLQEDLKEDTESFNKLMITLYRKFQETIGREGQTLLSNTRKIVQSTEDQLKELGVFEGKILGMEPYFENLQDAALDLEELVLGKVMPNIQDMAAHAGLDPEEVESALLGPANKLLQKFQEIDEQEMSVDELQGELKSVADNITESYKEARNSSAKLRDTQDAMVDHMINMLSNAKQMEEENEAIQEAYEKQLSDIKGLTKFWENLKQTASEYGTILTSWRAIGIFGLSALMSAASSLAGYFLSINRTMQGLAEDTGMLSGHLQEARDDSMEMHGALMATGADFEQIVGAAGVIRSELSGAQTAVDRMGFESSKQLQRNIVEVAQGFNISNSEAAGLLSTMNTITGATGKQLQQGMRYAQELSRINDVAPQQVIQDMAEASGELAKFGALTAEEMANAAVQARRMGSNLNEVLGVAEKFRQDITGSVQDLQRAELMLGQPIDTQGLVEASFEGPEQFTKQFRAQLDQLNLDLENLPTYRLQSLADATGMSVQKLRQMSRAAEQADMSFGRLGDKGVSALNNKLTSSQTTWNKLMNTISGLGTMLLNMIAGPIFNTVNPIIESLSNILGEVLEDMGNLKNMGIGDFFSSFTSNLQDVEESATGTKAKTASMATSLIEGVKMIYQGAKNLWPILKGIGQTIYELGETVGTAMSYLNSFAEWVAWANPMVEESQATFWTYAAAITAFGGAIYAIGQTMSGASAQLGAAAGVMLAFAGSLWILSNAMENFAEAGYNAVGVMFATALAVGAIGGALAAVVGSGAGAGLALGAAGLLGAFAAGLWVASRAMMNFGQAANSIITAVERIQQLENLSGLIPKIKRLTDALSGMPSAGFGDFFAGMVGEGLGDQLGMIVDLAHSAEPLGLVADSMERIATSLERIAAAEIGGKLHQIEDATSTSLGEGTGQLLSKTGGAIKQFVSGVFGGGEPRVNASQEGQVSSPKVDVDTATMEGGGTTTQTTTAGGETETAKDILRDIRNTENALLSSMRNGDIRVYIDGEDMTDTVYKHSNKRNQSG